MLGYVHSPTSVFKGFLFYLLHKINHSNFSSLIFADVIGLLTHIKPIESKITKRNTTTDMRQIEIMIAE
jgi:hypothetical protein